MTNSGSKKIDKKYSHLINHEIEDILGREAL